MSTDSHPSTIDANGETYSQVGMMRVTKEDSSQFDSMVFSMVANSLVCTEIKTDEADIKYVYFTWKDETGERLVLFLMCNDKTKTVNPCPIGSLGMLVLYILHDLSDGSPMALFSLLLSSNEGESLEECLERLGTSREDSNKDA